MANSKKREEIFSYEDNSVIVETLMIEWRTKFLVHDKETKENSFKDSINIDEIEYKPVPPRNSLITTETIRLFTNVWEENSQDELIAQLMDFISTYVDCTEDFLLISSYYVIMTYCFHKFEEIPYLRVLWDYWSWKSRFLKVLSSVCYNTTQINGSASTASIFRIMDLFWWTFAFDEADFTGTDTTNDIVKILNNGFQKWQSVFRSDWDDHYPRAFNVFCPKIIWGRREFLDKALESRCFGEVMTQTKRTDIKELDTEFQERAENLRNNLLAFKLSLPKDLWTLEQYDMEGLDPRLKQILKPILALISQENREIWEKIVSFQKKKQQDLVQDRQMSLEWKILEIIAEWYYWKQSDKISFKTIVEEVKQDTDYARVNVTSRTIGAILRQFQISEFVRSSGGTNVSYSLNSDAIETILEKFQISKEYKTKES